MDEKKELIAKFEKEIKEQEEKLNDESLSSMEKEMIRSKIRSLNMNITMINANEEN